MADFEYYHIICNRLWCRTRRYRRLTASVRACNMHSKALVESNVLVSCLLAIRCHLCFCYALHCIRPACRSRFLQCISRVAFFYLPPWNVASTVLDAEPYGDWRKKTEQPSGRNEAAIDSNLGASGSSWQLERGLACASAGKLDYTLVMRTDPRPLAFSV